MPGQGLAGGLPHFAYAQGVEKTRQSGFLAARQGVEKVLRGFFAHAFQAHELFLGEVVQVGRIMHQLPIDQLLHQLVAQALDVHGPAGSKVLDGFPALGGTVQAAGAARHGLAFGLDDVGTADGAVFGQHHFPGVPGTALGKHAHDLGNHIPGPAHIDRIADTHVLAAHLIHVVQGGVAHHHAPHFHGRQARHRGDGAGAAHLEFHVPDGGQGLLGGKLAGDGPARGAGDVAQALLLFQVVDLEHHAVDLIVQAVALLAHGGEIVQAALKAGHHLQLGRHGQAIAPDDFHDAAVAVAQRLHGQLAPAIGIKGQGAAGGDLGIELAQAARGGVARVGEGLFPLAPGAFIECLETLFGHENLAAHFQHFGPALPQQAQGNGADGAHVGGDILAPVAVPPGRTLHQEAVLVAQADGQAVQLGLGAVFHLLHFQQLAHALVEIGHLPVAEGIAQGQHGHGMADFGKFLQGLGAHSLSGGIRGNQFGMGGLQFLEFAHEAVILAVRNLRVIQHVVTVVVVIDLLAQLTNPRFQGLVVHLCSLARRS